LKRWIETLAVRRKPAGAAAKEFTDTSADFGPREGGKGNDCGKIERGASGRFEDVLA